MWDGLIKVSVKNFKINLLCSYFANLKGPVLVWYKTSKQKLKNMKSFEYLKVDLLVLIRWTEL